MKQNRLTEDQKEKLFDMYKTYQYSYNDCSIYLERKYQKYLKYYTS